MCKQTHPFSLKDFYKGGIVLECTLIRSNYVDTKQRGISMKVIRTLNRINVNNLDTVLPFYEELLNLKTEMRFKFSALELASIGNFLFIAGKEEDLQPFINTKVTLLVDSIADFKTYLERNGAQIVRGPMEVPTGKNMTVKHPDGSLIEYVEHLK